VVVGVPVREQIRRQQRRRGVTFDQALDTILALEALWRARRGQVRLLDLGIAPHGLVRARKSAALPAKPWRGFPAAKPTRREWLEGV